jgi:hypothetical protein
MMSDLSWLTSWLPSLCGKRGSGNAIDIVRARAPLAYRNWFRHALALRRSSDPNERASILLGWLAGNGVPVLYPRDALLSHIAVEAGTEGGKSSRVLAPLLEQWMSFPDCSAFVIDGKADSSDFIATAQAIAQFAAAQGREVKVKYFTPVLGDATFILNPFTQATWDRMDYSQRADYLCAMLGLQYGRDYGPGYFSDGNARSAAHAVQKYPNFKTIRELNRFIRHEAVAHNKEEIPPETRRAGSHVESALYRLEHLEALNATADTHPAAAIANQISFTEPFVTPHIHVLHLPASVGPEASAMIGRLYLYGILAGAAALGPSRPLKVLGIIDETARFVAKNMDHVLQTARSASVGICTAVQSRKDLITATSDLASVLDTNARLRFWLSVSDIDVIERLSKLSGTTVETLQSTSEEYSFFQRWRMTGYSRTEAEVIVPRLSVNDILEISDDPDLAVMQITRGAGFAQFGGYTQAIRTAHHITEAEHQRRRLTPWPAATAQTIVPKLPLAGDSAPAPQALPAPIIIETAPELPKTRPKRNTRFPPNAGNSN